MSEKTQLTRINVPAITDARYIEGMSDAFDKINDNFKKIASLPFLQGVQGDSYQLEEYKIWDDWLITEDGKVLLDSIFGKDVTVKGNSFDKIRECIGEDLAGTSPIDFFKNGNDIVNNSLYFYVIKDDTGNVIEKQLGQYYYFIDGRLKDIGNVYNDGVSLNGFNDYTGFYQYKYDSENNSKYVKVEILPTIYYDQNKNDICWKFNGNKTGISAIGVKGADGKDADLLIVRVTANENDCTGVVNAIINPIGGNTAEDQWIENPKDFKVGKALICIQRDNTAQDFAYGQVIYSGDTFNAYWEPNYNFSKLIGNNRITNYFYNMGEDDTETSPFYLAIPSSYNRGASGTAENKMKAHVIKGSSETSEDLNIFYSENAFGSNGEQKDTVTSSGSTKKLNIKNYNTTIDKKLTVSGSAEVSGGLTVKNGGAVISSGGIQVTTQKPAAAPGTNNYADVKSNVLKGHNDPGDGAYKYFPDDITKGGYPLVTMSYDGDGIESKDCMVFGNGDICALKWNGTKYEKGELCLQDVFGYYGKTKIGGSFEVGGTSLLKGAVTMNSTLGVTDGATFSGTATFNKPVTLGSSASLTVGGSATFNKAATFSGGTSTFNSPVTMNSSLGVSGIANFNSPVTISSTLRVTNTATFATATFGGTATFNSSSNLNGLVRVNNDQDSSSKSSGALVVTGGVGIARNLYVGSSTNISGKITGGSGIKIYGGTSEFYSGTGTEDNSNYLKVDSTSVTVGGGVGRLNVKDRVVVNSINTYAKSNGGESYGIKELINGSEGNIHCGGNSDVGTTGAYRTVYNRSAVQSYYQKLESGTQTYTGSTFFINPNGGSVIIGRSANTKYSSLTVNGATDSTSLTVNGKSDLSGIVNIKSGSSSTGTGTGALVVTGGVGIGKQLYVGDKITGNSGIKIIGGNSYGIDMYSGTGATTDSNHLKVDANGVLIDGGIGALQLNGGTASVSINGTYDSEKETGSNLNTIADANHPGYLYLGAAPNNKTLPINRLLLNRHTIQAYTTYGGSTTNSEGKVVSVYKSPAASSFRINPCGGDVIINNTSSTTTIKGPLRVEGNVLTDLAVNGKIKGALNEGYVTWNNTITTDSKGNRVYDLKTINPGSVSPIGAAWSNIGSSNAFALFKSTFDGKATNNWGYMYKTASGKLTNINKGKFTDDTLFNLFNNNSASINIGHQTSTPSAGESTTIQIFANSIKKAGSASDTYTTFYYGKIKKILFLVAKGGCELALTIKGNDPKGNSVTIVDNYSLAGDSGWNEVPLNITFGGNRQGLDSGNVSDFQRFYSLSFIFTIKSVYSGYTPRAVLKGIRVLSDIQWELNAFTSPNISKSGRIYTYDKDANTTFPAKVTTTKGLTVTEGGLTVSKGGADIKGTTIIQDLTLTTASTVAVTLSSDDISAGFKARKRITSGGIIGGVGQKTGFTLDSTVPAGTIFIVTGGAGTNRYFSNKNGWKKFSGGIYRVATNEDYDDEIDLYCICSPYVKQGWVGREHYG